VFGLLGGDPASYVPDQVLPSPCSPGSTVLTPGPFRRQPGRDRPPLQEAAWRQPPVQRSLHYDKPTEGIWALLKRSMANFAAADVSGLARIIKRKLKKIQHRPHLIDGCLAATGLKIEPW
jgi:hypothetical protein